MDPIQIQVSKLIPGKKWKILRLLTRLQDYPKFMPSVKECKLIERRGTIAITEWKVEMDKIPLRWTEEDTLDLKNFSFRFRAIAGDLEHFEGEWILRDHPSGNTALTVNLSVRIGIPTIDHVIGKVLADKIKKNFEKMLDALSDQIAKVRYKNIRHRNISDVRGFAVIGHPYDIPHLVQYLKFLNPEMREPSQDFLMKIFDLAPSYKAYDIKGFKSKTGKIVNGYFIMCPIIPAMLAIDADRVMGKVYQACKVAEELGAGIVTLGGFTSIAGERFGKSLASMVHVPVTTGNTFTVAMVIQGIHKAAKLLDLNLTDASVAIIGGGGDIGSGCARILASQVAKVTITGRNERSLMETERLLSYAGSAQIATSTDNNKAIKDADIVIAAASAANAIVDTQLFKSGAIVCDVGYPKNISYGEKVRKDILVFSGGITSVPSEFNLGFDIGMPSTRVLYGCFAEAVILDLEERYENYSSGKGNITPEKVQQLSEWGARHGFEVAPLFWGHTLLNEKDIDEIRMNVQSLR